MLPANPPSDSYGNSASDYLLFYLIRSWPALILLKKQELPEVLVSRRKVHFL